MELSVSDRALLDFERQWWTLSGVAAKGELIRAHLGIHLLATISASAPCWTIPQRTSTTPDREAPSSPP